MEKLVVLPALRPDMFMVALSADAGLDGWYALFGKGKAYLDGVPLNREMKNPAFMRRIFRKRTWSKEFQRRSRQGANVHLVPA